MDLKHLNSENKTPKSNSKLVTNKVFSSTVNNDSPYKSMPNFSTPPSRFTKIVNPFENYLLERLHLPTFSPSVFAKVSTPKLEEKFKWTIDDISRVKPADIDEATIDQHVFDEDPHVESIVQSKIEQFFSEKVIVPSPMSQEIKRVPLIAETPSPKLLKQCCDGTTQTVLTLPPKLPEHIEAILQPYFTYNEDQQQSNHFSENTSLYRKLFENESPELECTRASLQSSPALSTGLSPIQFSPLHDREKDRSLGSPFDMPELRECNLSPIAWRSPKEAKSACRLSFSGRMSVDASLLVPDIGNQMPNQSVYLEDNQPPNFHEVLSNSTINWDMEYKQVSLGSPTSSNNSSDRMDVSNSNTPHSKIFTSQRKRLSDSFKDEDEEFTANKENEPQINLEEVIRRNKSKLFKEEDFTDVGYHTGGTTTLYDNTNSMNSHMFASTPSKKDHNNYYV